MEIFEEWYKTKDGPLKPMLHEEVYRPLEAFYGVLSERDGETAIEMDRLRVDASRTGVGGESGESGGVEENQVQSNECRDCVEMQMDFLKPAEMDSLKVEARLMNGVSAAALSGVLWLTFVTAAG